MAAKKRNGTNEAEAFFDARVSACWFIAAVHGQAWHLVPGATHWCRLASRLRSFRTPRGTLIKSRADARLPAPQYWPGGVLPEGVGVSTPVHTPPTPWVRRKVEGAWVEMDPLFARYFDATQDARRAKAALNQLQEKE